MTTKTASKPMLMWQWRSLLAELSQVTMHSIDESCPCNQVALDPPEYCLAKHLLNIHSLAAETQLMDEANAALLEELSSEALEHHEKAKTIYCEGGVWPDLATWSREWRKRIEPIYYACQMAKATMKQDAMKQCDVKYCTGGAKMETEMKQTEGAKMSQDAKVIKELDEQIIETAAKKQPLGYLTGLKEGLKECLVSVAQDSLLSKGAEMEAKKEAMVSIPKRVWEDAVLVSLGVEVDPHQKEGLREMASTVARYVYGIAEVKQTEASLADPLLPTLAKALCTTGVCLASEDSEPLPICTKAQAKKLESCTLALKARNVKAGCKPEGTGSKKCPNVFAVCRSALSCRRSVKYEEKA